MNENCYNDILYNKQFIKKNIDYIGDEICASMNIGKKRNRQEDGILILDNRKFKNKKIIAVADGMGGMANGNMASNLTLLHLANWFLKFDKYNLSSMDIINNLKDEIEEIDLYIRNRCGTGGTTLAACLLLDELAIFVNVGDSRIYIKNGANFYQLSEDHSITWDLYNKGEIASKDLMRFHKMNNLITSRIGCENKKLKIDNYILNRNQYDSIFLFTDGVTDCLSDENLIKIICKSDTNNVSKSIIYNALAINSFRNDLDDNYYNTIYGGKDNSSAIVYTKKLERR